MIQVTENDPNFSAIQWDGTEPVKDQLVDILLNGQGYTNVDEWTATVTPEGVLELVETSYSGRMEVAPNSWVILGPYFGSLPEFPPISVLTNAEYTARFTATP